MQILKELYKLHWQKSVGAAILMALRARIEFRRKVKNRIGQTFPEGCRGALLVGKGGSGKTRLLKSIYDGLGLDTTSSDGRKIAKWVPSAGASTAVGLAETLELYNDSVIFVDEFSLDTPSHLHLVKQIASSTIQRLKHDYTDPVPFTGMLVAATNSIRIPRNNTLEHLLAVLDRFTVVKTKTPQISPNDYLNMALENSTAEQIDWSLIKSHLTSNNEDNLNSNEQTLLRKLWGRKCEQLLDKTRPQWRNAHAARDICLFAKRFLNVPDISKNKDVIRFISDMMNDTILFNPINILWLNPIEETIYNTISSKPEVSLQEIVSACDNSGISVSVKHIHNIINVLISNIVIYRTRHGMYSVRKTEPKESNKEHDIIREVL